LEGRKELEEGRDPSVHKLHPKLEVLHSLTEFEDQFVEDGETLFQLQIVLDLGDTDVLFRSARTGDGTPMGDFEEPATGERGGLKVLAVDGATRWRREEPGKLSIMTKHSKRETGEVEEERGANLGNISGKEGVEGEPGGETDARGRGGCQGEPLRGHPH